MYSYAGWISILLPVIITGSWICSCYVRALYIDTTAVPDAAAVYMCTYLDKCVRLLGEGVRGGFCAVSLFRVEFTGRLVIRPLWFDEPSTGAFTEQSEITEQWDILY